MLVICCAKYTSNSIIILVWKYWKYSYIYTKLQTERRNAVESQLQLEENVLKVKTLVWAVGHSEGNAE